MKPHIASLLRHVATWIAGLTAVVMTLPFMLPEDAAAVAENVDKVAAGVVGLLAVIAVRALPWIGAWLVGLLKDFRSGGNGAISLVGMVGTAAALSMAGLGLSSCSALSDYDFKGAVVYRFGDEGAKAGLTLSPGKPAQGFVRYPLTDPDTGEVTGWVDVEAGRKVEAAK